MADITSFDAIYQLFFYRIEKDESFFDYYNIELEDAMRLAKQRTKNYLTEALDKLSSKSGLLQVDFADYDIEAGYIGFELTGTEKDIVVNLMFQIYMERDLPLLHAFKINFTPGDLTVFSPANERNSYEAFITRLKQDNKIAFDDYISRDRLTGKLKHTIDYTAYNDI